MGCSSKSKQAFAHIGNGFLNLDLCIASRTELRIR